MTDRQLDPHDDVPASLVIVFVAEVPERVRNDTSGWAAWLDEIVAHARAVENEDLGETDGPSKIIAAGIAVHSDADRLRDVFEPRLGGDRP